MAKKAGILKDTPSSLTAAFAVMQQAAREYEQKRYQFDTFRLARLQQEAVDRVQVDRYKILSKLARSIYFAVAAARSDSVVELDINGIHYKWTIAYAKLAYQRLRSSPASALPAKVTDRKGITFIK